MRSTGREPAGRGSPGSGSAGSGSVVSGTGRAGTVWNPAQYARYADYRARPFRDLLAAVGAQAPRLVVDLGCGNGPLTLSLGHRWPGARIIGVDHSPQMLAAARALDVGGRVEWVEADLAAWDPSLLDAEPDVIVTNAALQWVPGHLDLLPGWVDALAPGGWLALQVPGNFDAPSHVLMREVAAGHPKAGELESALARPAAASAQTYLAVLSAAGCEVDAWETTYLHRLDPDGKEEDPVLEWVRGTGLRPVLDTLTEPSERAAFLEEYAGRLRTAYPRTVAGVVLPFRRVFAVAHRPREGPLPPRPPVRGLHHVQVGMPAGAEPALRAFYGDVLGLAEIPKPPAMAARGGLWFAAGAQELHCGVEREFAPARKAHPCLLVADVEAVAARVAAAGGEVSWDDQIAGVRRFHTVDPVGNRVEVRQD
jgi:trans-aconitate methyltransferase/predicted enzyme related to lactoylglutathione lyase